MRLLSICSSPNDLIPGVSIIQPCFEICIATALDEVCRPLPRSEERRVLFRSKEAMMRLLSICSSPNDLIPGVSIIQPCFEICIATALDEVCLYPDRKSVVCSSDLAKRFEVGVASVVRWSKKPIPQTHRNKPASKLDIESLKQDITLYPDAYQYERAERLKVSASGVWHALRRLKVTFKKNSSASKGGFREAIYLLPKA